MKIQTKLQFATGYEDFENRWTEGKYEQYTVKKLDTFVATPNLPFWVYC